MPPAQGVPYYADRLPVAAQLPFELLNIPLHADSNVVLFAYGGQRSSRCTASENRLNPNRSSDLMLGLSRRYSLLPCKEHVQRVRESVYFPEWTSHHWQRL